MSICAYVLGSMYSNRFLYDLFKRFVFRVLMTTSSRLVFPQGLCSVVSWHNVKSTRPLGRVHATISVSPIASESTETEQKPDKTLWGPLSNFFLLSAPRVPVATCLSSWRCLWGWHARKCRHYWCLRRNMCGCSLPCNVNKANVCKQTATGRPNLSVKETKHCPAEIPSAGAVVSKQALLSLC